MTFIEKVDLLRRVNGLSERALAHELGLNPSSISRWRSRGGTPRPNVVAKIAKRFNVAVQTLTDDRESVPEERLFDGVADAANKARARHPENQAAAQELFHLKLEVEAEKQRRSQMADFLRSTSRKLRTEAAALDREADKLDPPKKA